MIDIANDIQSLSYFKRNSAKLLSRLNKTKKPLVLTVNGKARMVLQDCESYQRLMKYQEESEMIDFLKRSKAQADAGKAVLAKELFNRLGRKS
jgi:prevent-host-death family protein